MHKKRSDDESSGDDDGREHIAEGHGNSRKGVGYQPESVTRVRDTIAYRCRQPHPDCYHGGMPEDPFKKSDNTKTRRKILFVCIGNACRSPIAEAIGRQDFAADWEVSSAGLSPLGYVHPMSIEALKQNGYETEGLQSKRVLRNALDEADLIINMSGYTTEQAFEVVRKPVEDWDVRDPFGSGTAQFQDCLEDIRVKLNDLKARLDAGAANEK